MIDFLYLDIQLVNSYLSKLNSDLLRKRIINNEKIEEPVAHQNYKTTNNTVANQADDKEWAIFSSVFSAKNSELIETAIRDFSFDLFLKKITEKGLVKEQQMDYQEGELLTITGAYEFFNFKQLSQLTESKNMGVILGDEINEKKRKMKDLRHFKGISKQVSLEKIAQLNEEIQQLEKSYKPYNDAHKFGQFCDQLFPKSSLIKINNTLSICPDENIHTETATNVFLTLSKRKISLVGIVLSKKEKNSEPSAGAQLPIEHIASNMPMIMIDTILTTFNISHVGDYYIRPIALYFTN